MSDKVDENVKDNEEKKNEENKEENNEVKENEENIDQSQLPLTPEATKKQEIVSDIIASNPIQVVDEPEDEVRAFTKKNVIEEVEFGWFNLNAYLDAQLQSVPVTLRVLGECLSVIILFMVFPVGLLFLIKGKTRGINVLKDILNVGVQKDQISNFVQFYVFLTCVYILYVIVYFISDNILYICLFILDLFNMSVTEFTVQILQIIRATSYYWTNSLIFWLIFQAHNFLFHKYQWAVGSTDKAFIFVTFVIWVSIWMFVLFVIKFCLTYCTSEIRRRDYRDRIWDINYKTFVFKKLVTISKTDKDGRKKVADSMVSDFDPGFYLKHNDIKLSSREDAINLVESIFAYFEIQTLSFEDIKEYFPDNPEEVYEYLADKKIENEKADPIKFERMQDAAIHLQQERSDMLRTLQDRDSIFNKLDLILTTAGTYGCFLILLFLFGIPYQIYLASIGPIFFTFSWIFSDTIKEIYNCFVFLLVKHPYDVGDRVIIDGQEYLVNKTDVLASTFIDLNGKTVYIPTPVLFSKTICNMRRSKKQSESLTLLIDRSTKFKDAIKFRDKLKKALSEEKKNFTGEVIIRKFEVTEGNLSLTLDIQHTSNFQQANEKLRRRDLCTEIVSKCLSSCGVKYTNSFKYVD